MPLFVGDAGPQDVSFDSDSPVILTYKDLPAVIAAALALSPNVKFKHAYHDGGVPTGYIFTYQVAAERPISIYIGANYDGFMDVANKAKMELHQLPRCDYYIYASDDFNEGGLGESPLPVISVIEWNEIQSSTSLKVHYYHSAASTQITDATDLLNIKLSAATPGISDVEYAVNLVTTSYESALFSQGGEKSSPFGTIFYCLSTLLTNKTGKPILTPETVKKLGANPHLLINLISLLKSFNPAPSVYQALQKHQHIGENIDFISQMSSTKVFPYALACMAASGYTPLNRHSLVHDEGYFAYAFFDPFLNRQILLLPPIMDDPRAVAAKTRLLLSHSYDCVITINIEENFLEQLAELFRQNHIKIPAQMLKTSSFGIYMLPTDKCKKEKVFALTSCNLDGSKVKVSTALTANKKSSIKNAGKALRYVNLPEFLSKFPHENNKQLLQIYNLDLNKSLNDNLKQLAIDSHAAEDPNAAEEKAKAGFSSTGLKKMFGKHTLTIEILSRAVFYYVRWLDTNMSKANYDKVTALYSALRTANVLVKEIDKHPLKESSQPELPQPDLALYSQHKSSCNEAQLLPHFAQALQDPSSLSKLEISIAKEEADVMTKMVKPKLVNHTLMTMMLGILRNEKFKIKKSCNHYLAEKVFNRFTNYNILLANCISLAAYQELSREHVGSTIFAIITDPSCQFPFLLYRFDEKYYANGYAQDHAAIETLIKTIKQPGDSNEPVIMMHQQDENSDKSNDVFCQALVKKLHPLNPRLADVKSVRINRGELNELDLGRITQQDKLLAAELPFATQPVMLRKVGSTIELFMQTSDIKACKGINIKDEFFKAFAKHQPNKATLELKVYEYRAPEKIDMFANLYQGAHSAMLTCGYIEAEAKVSFDAAAMIYNCGCKETKEQPIPAQHKLRQCAAEVTGPVTLLYEALLDSHHHAGLPLVHSMDMSYGHMVVFNYPGYDEHIVICPPLLNEAFKEDLQTNINIFARDHKLSANALKIYCCTPCGATESAQLHFCLPGQKSAWHSKAFNTRPLDENALGFITGIGQHEQAFFAFSTPSLEGTTRSSNALLDIAKNKHEKLGGLKLYSTTPKLTRGGSSSSLSAIKMFGSRNKKGLAASPNGAAIRANREELLRNATKSLSPLPIVF